MNVWKFAIGLNFVVINAPMISETDGILLLVRHVIISIGCLLIANGLNECHKNG